MPTSVLGWRTRWNWIAAGGLVLAVGIGIFLVSQQSSHQRSSSTQGSSKYPYQVGSPGPGETAPPVRLTAVDGTKFDLSTWQGKTVLLYFQEGVGCQPCWDQLKEINSKSADFRAIGIDQIITITGDGPAKLRQKVVLEHVVTPVLSDPGLQVSQTYHANSYGMMGSSADGHTFIVVGPDGRIEWRADYGGPPNFTMYLPVPKLIADLRRGLKR